MSSSPPITSPQHDTTGTTSTAAATGEAPSAQPTAHADSRVPSLPLPVAAASPSSPSPAPAFAATQSTGLASSLAVAEPASVQSAPAASPAPPTLERTHAHAAGSAASSSSSSSSAAASASPSASASASAAFPPRPTTLPILSLPALPGQRVCGCMRAVSQAPNVHAIVPTSPATIATAESVTAALSAAAAAPLSASSPPAPTLESVLSLQDRFWLSVGEVALHNDDCSVERGVDSLESVAVKLAHLSQQLTHQMRVLHDDQIAGVQSLMVEMEIKNRDLVDYLRLTRGEEATIRERIDGLSGEVEKAKKTVVMGGTLSLASAKQARERAHLDSVRIQRDAALKQLETIVSARTLAQNQMLNVGTIVSECRRTDMDRRDYKCLYQQVQHACFLRSFGALYQTQVLTLVKALSRLRDMSHECDRRRRRVEHTSSEIRGRIAMVVAAYWK